MAACTELLRAWAHIGDAQQGAPAVQEAQVPRRALAGRPKHALHALLPEHLDPPIRGAHLPQSKTAMYSCFYAGTALAFLQA